MNRTFARGIGSCAVALLAGVCGIPGALAAPQPLPPPAPLHAHPDEQHTADDQPPYEGEGWVEQQGGSAPISFPSSGVTLRIWLPLHEFGDSADGADCWGYVSPSGREYALIGLDDGAGVAEVTDPGNAQFVTHLPGPASIWRDIKTYQHFAYVVSEGGNGIQVFDLADIDNGVAIHKGDITLGANPWTHNVHVNEESGKLYRAGVSGSPLRGIVSYDLANPNKPIAEGYYNSRYCHDVQVVTWTEAPFAGVEVAFCYANDTETSGNPGIEILDVSNPALFTTIGSINLSVPPIFSHAAEYSHQGWLSPDRRYVYFNDEIDEDHGGLTLTRIIDVQDLTAPVQVATFQNTTAARDHNLYTKGTKIFQANYRSGLRVLDATDPLALSEIAFFDTYPPDDDAAYNGLWSVYPYLPSGTVIGCDIEKGLFVWTLDTQQVPLLPSGSEQAWFWTATCAALLTGAAVARRRRRA